MIKLKNILFENIQDDLTIFLKDFKSKNPTASTDEISIAIEDFLMNNNIITESPLSSLLKTIAMATLLVYGANKSDIINSDVMSKIKDRISQVTTHDKSNKIPKSVKRINKNISGINAKMSSWIEMYSKKYKIHHNNAYRLFKRESGFTKGNNNYNPSVVGDIGNTLGPSYGAGQVKVPVAKELYENFPEPDVNPNEITAEKLKNDVEFNVRTSLKLLASHFYHHKKIKNIKNPRNRMAFAATAYNAGPGGAMKWGINKYGKEIAGIH